MNRNRQEKGITLIALVITIIILLILAGITIVQLTGNGLFGKSKLANQKTRYANAKETVNLKLMEIQLDCEEKGERYNLIKIAEGMKEAEEITIEKYYNKETATIKEGVTENIINLEGIVVSVDEYSEYKFLIGESCEIEAVLKEEITDNTKMQDFIDIEEFELKEFEGRVEATNNIEFSYEKKRIANNKMQLLIIIKDEENGLNKIEYPDGDILNCDGKNQIGIDYIIEFNQEYIFKITSNDGSEKEVLIYEEYNCKLVDHWNLGVQNEDFEIYKGKPEYLGEEEGLYLNKSVISTKENYILNTEYTIILEAKNVSPTGDGFLISMGKGSSQHGSTSLGISHGVNAIYATSGAGNSYNVSTNLKFPKDNQWHILAIKYDGFEFSIFIDGKKKGSSSESEVINSKLYVGGISNSGTTISGVNWGYGNGYYRNLAIYSGALTDEELENYSF